MSLKTFFQDPENRFSVELFPWADEFFEEAQSFLSPEEILIFANISNIQRKKQYLQSRFRLKKKLSEITGTAPQQINFQFAGQGKPFLTENPSKIDFNMSHSAHYFVLAWTFLGQIGIDIEAVREHRFLTEGMQKVFTEKEIQFVLRSEIKILQQQRFTKIWSGKEALVKAAARGIFTDALEIEIDCDSWQPRRLPLAYGDVLRWRLSFFEEISDHIISVAVKMDSL